MKIAVFLIIGFISLLSLKAKAQEKHRSPVAYILVKEFGGRQNFDTLVTFDTLGRNLDRWIQTFDEKGNTLSQTKEKWSNNKWIPENYTTSTYDKAGNQLTCFLGGNQKNLKLEARYFYKYDSKGNELSESVKMCYNDICEDGSTKISTYDSNGNKLTLIQKEWKDNQWIMTSDYSYAYDKKGNKLSEFYKTYHNKILMTGGRFTYLYNSKGKLISKLGETLKDGSWVLNYKQIYTFDNYGNELSMLHQLWDKGSWINVQREICAYDSRNNKLSKTQDDWKSGNWKTNQVIKWEYDSLSNIIVQESGFSENTNIFFIAKITFGYDDKRNLIEQRDYTMRNKKWELFKILLQDFDKMGNLIKRETQDFKDGKSTGLIRYEYNYDPNYLSLTGTIHKLDGETYKPTEILNSGELGFHFDKKNKMSTYNCYMFKASIIPIK